MAESVAAEPAKSHLTRATRMRRGLIPYLLNLPNWAYLGLFFVVPLLSVLALSLSYGNPEVGYSYNWPLHWGEFSDAISTYHVQLLRSFWYGIASTGLTLAIAYPVAYWIAFYGGRHKSTFLFLVLLPFFVSYIIRTLAWQFILSDQGIVLGHLKAWGMLPESFHILSTSWAVIWGLTYNGIPFYVLPLYVAIERIDRRVVRAASDLYANTTWTFLKVILPLSVTGIFAGFLLTFVTNVGDYVNQQVLGGTGTYMIGSVIQDSFFTNQDYPMASALSSILMLLLLICIWLYARTFGSEAIQEYA